MAGNLQKYLRPGISSTLFCPGCGLRVLSSLVLKAIDELELNIDDMLFVSGIGCAAWIPSPHFNADTLHTLHGRAIAFATGAKMVNPKLKVMVISGDGDLGDIGGNHFIHAARRNMDFTVICANNQNYGMTGGQVACTTPIGALTATTTEGNVYRPMDMCKLAQAAGATYVAKYSVTQPLLLTESIKKALGIKGFSFIEVWAPCHTQFGRRNLFDNPAEMFRDLKNRCIMIEETEGLSPEELEGRIITGEFCDASDYAD